VTMTPETNTELQRRRELWEDIQTSDPANTVPKALRNMSVYGGAAGIWRDKKRTSHLPSAAEGVAVSLLHTGRHYADDLSHDGIIYHYPSSDRPGSTDQGEIQSVKNASLLDLPVFVISPGTSRATARNVRLAWIVDWDDKEAIFLVLFGDEAQAYQPPADPDAPFTLRSKQKQKYSRTKTRPNQKKFRFQVLSKYGIKCAVCDISDERLIHAAHICDKEFGGTDDWRNGIPLCANHHIAFDEGLFKVIPETRVLAGQDSLPLAALGVSETKLSPKVGFPHRDALVWKFNQRKSSIEKS
jgi:putative restriction endonuclease